MALTRPQVKMLTRAMRDGVSPARQQWKTSGILERAGFLESGEHGRMSVTRAGLSALREYRLAQYGLHGSMASIAALEEVDAALAEQVTAS